MSELRGVSINRNSSLSGVAMVLLALYPMLHWYDIGLPIGLGDVLMILLSMVAIGMQKFKIRAYPWLFLLVWAYVAIVWYYYNISSDLKTLLPGGIFFFFFAVNMGTGISLFHMEKLKMCMKLVVILAIIVFLFEYIMLSVGGIRFCMVPNLTGHFTYEGLTYAELVAKHLSSNKPCAFFIEKSYMAYYLVIYLCLELFTGKGKEMLITPLSIIIILVLLLLRSGSGLVGMVIPIFVKIMSYYWQKRRGAGILFLAISIPIVIMAVYFYVRTDIGSSMLERQDEITTEGTSGFTRVMYGYFFYDQLAPLQKLIGTSVTDINDLIYISYSDRKFALNGIQNILVSLGAIGLALWILFYLKVMRDTTLCGICCVCVFFVLSAIEVTYLGSYMLLLTIVACSEISNKKLKVT